MKCFLLSAVLLFVGSLASPKASAFVEDPYITPAHPTPDTPISVRVRMGGCHGSFDAVDGAKLEMSAPGQLRLITNGEALDPGHPFCNAPVFNYRFEIGTLPEGVYSLQFFIRDEFSGSGLVGFGSVTFVVASPARIPATSVWPLTAMTLALSLLAIVAWDRSREADDDANVVEFQALAGVDAAHLLDGAVGDDPQAPVAAEVPLLCVALFGDHDVGGKSLAGA